MSCKETLLPTTSREGMTSTMSSPSLTRRSPVMRRSSSADSATKAMVFEAGMPFVPRLGGTPAEENSSRRSSEPFFKMFFFFCAVVVAVKLGGYLDSGGSIIEEVQVQGPIITALPATNSSVSSKSSSITLEPIVRPIDFTQYTIRMNTWKREEQLEVTIHHHATCPGVAQIQVIWCTAQGQPPAWLLNHPKVVVEYHDVNSLNERFNIIQEPPTIGILSIDDDVLRPCVALDQAFFTWTHNPERMIGFNPRTFVNQEDGSWFYLHDRNEYCLTLTNVAFLHRDYLRSYMQDMPKVILQHVETNMNCEDIAMSLWISYLTDAKRPLLANRWAYDTEVKLESGNSISKGFGHMKDRSYCFDSFAQVLDLKSRLVPTNLWDQLYFSNRDLDVDSRVNNPKPERQLEVERKEAELQKLNIAELEEELKRMGNEIAGEARERGMTKDSKQRLFSGSPGNTEDNPPPAREVHIAEFDPSAVVFQEEKIEGKKEIRVKASTNKFRLNTLPKETVAPQPKTEENVLKKALRSTEVAKEKQAEEPKKSSEKPETIEFRLDTFKDAPTCDAISPDDIEFTMVTQASKERLKMFRHLCRRWGPHPMSLSIMTDESVAETKQQLVDMGCWKDQLKVHVSPMDTINDYPTNMLRNRAIDAVTTSHFVFIDIDFWPSEDLHENLMQKSVREIFAKDAKAAVVVPAFTMTNSCEKRGSPDCPDQQNTKLMPYSKIALLPLLESGIIDHATAPTHETAHGSTLYQAWMTQTADQVLPISCLKSYRFEPYLATRKCRDLPHFPEQFTGYGKNKNAWMLQLRYAGWAFWQIGESFLVHFPHKHSKARDAWNTSRKNKIDGSIEVSTSSITDVMKYKRALNDKMFIDYRNWVHDTQKDQSRVAKCIESTMNDDEFNLVKASQV